jgi:hypothetical protein
MLTKSTKAQEMRVEKERKKGEKEEVRRRKKADAEAKKERKQAEREALKNKKEGLRQAKALKQQEKERQRWACLSLYSLLPSSVYLHFTIACLQGRAARAGET